MINKNFIRQSLVKSISIITTVSFLFTGVFSEIVFASIDIEKANLNKEILNTFIPSSIGRITSAKYYDSDEVVINIQDLHCHVETQKNIVKIIEYIDKNYNLNEVYLEGAVGNVDTSWLSSLKKTGFGYQIIESLLNLGRLSGAEYYSVVNDKNKFIVGIENNNIYEDNIKLLNQIVSVYPEVSAICQQMNREIGNVKKDYFNKDIRRLERLILKFQKNKINAKKYYAELEKISKRVNEPLDKYKNIKLYVELLNRMRSINIEKIPQQFKTFITVLKSQIPYQQYTELSNISNNFTNMENISLELLNLSNQYGICEKYKLSQLNDYLVCLEFNKTINPINFVEEEKELINNLYIKLGKTKYEQEVAFLSEFIPTIKDYFTANITKDDYYRFNEKFIAFRKIWNSYFSENTVKDLDKYAQMLSKYHENNLKRDKIFADILSNGDNTNNMLSVKNNNIIDNLKNKKIKLIITGGFHSKGLEKIFEKRRISYVVITPNVTQIDLEANNTHLETIKEYVDILNDTINIRPLSEEPLNISFPKILASIFVNLNLNTSLSQNVKVEYINNVVKEVSQTHSVGNISLEKCSIDSLSTSDAKFSVTYKDKSNNNMESTYEYLLDSNGIIQTYAQINTSKTIDMIDRYFGNKKYSLPSIIFEPDNSARKKIGKAVVEKLKFVAGNSISFMPVEKLHLTIAYDIGSEMTESQIQEAINAKDVSNPIFADTEKLGKSLNYVKSPLEGKIKLMPDGVIILEISNEEIISQILGLRNILKKGNKYDFPKIVHMTIGRITDTNLLNGSNQQSRQQLANLISKLNDKIYEINKQNQLSKIKSSFSIKSGYLSATGDQDYLVIKVKPSSQLLSILNNLFKDIKSIKYKFYTCFIAPIWEETVFRFLPFMITGLFATNTELMPILITSISGTLLFPLVHIIVDKITSNTDNKNSKSLFISSAVLTSSYLLISAIFPGMPLLALATSTVLHSIYNVLSLRGIIKTKVLSIFDNKEINDIDKKIIDFTSRVREILTNYENKGRGYNVDKNIVSDINSILDSLEKANVLSKDEKSNIFSKSVDDLFKLVVSLRTNKDVYFDLNYLLEPILISSVYVKDDTDNSLFDKLIEFEISEGKRTGSSRFKEQLIYMVEYFYNINKQYSYEILKVLYENNILPLPSPLGFSSVDEWEKEISSVISKSKQYEHFYINMVEIFYPINKEYAYAILRALYKNGYCQKTPFVRFSHGYQWEKEFNSIISSYNISDEPLITFKSINDKELLEKYNISFNDIIARLQYIKKLSKYEKTESIHKQYDEILETLISAKDNSKNEKYKIVVEQMNILSNLLLSDVTKNRSLAMEMLETLAPVWLYIKYADSEDSLLNNIINLLLLDEVKNYKSRFDSNERVSYDFKAKFYRIFEQIYPVDKQFALDILNKFHNIEPFAKYPDWMPGDIGDAYQNMPSELSDAIKKYEDLELFYEAVGVEWDDVNQESLIYDKYFHTYDYMKIFEMLPKNLVEQLKNLHNKPVYFRYKKSKYNSDNTKSKKTTNRFTFFNEILENNSLALEELNTTDARAMYAAIVFLEKMIEGLKQIDQQHGEAAQKALNNIKKLYLD
ncbi:MAG: CPBP family intramembrane metalloprotease [Endomicrobiaceae bacterium]|nr:CPBP family intramembrane metalloprotease [Endomicrobiaceae bacterium]